MAKTNYNKMSDKVKADANIEASSLDVEQEVAETEEVVEETATEEVAETEDSTPEFKTGIVTDCMKLNMRVAPSLDAKIRGTLDKGVTVVILGEEGDFYKIGNPENPDYCMKKYISVK
jgi:uncharacterized protein YgiM (DUF1202 family)